jgi:hypothetical protein
LAKMLTCGTLKSFMMTWNTLFSKKNYMWDPTEFYDNFEHSIFEKKIYMWDPTEFYDNFEHSIFEIKYTCWTKVGL